MQKHSLARNAERHATRSRSGADISQLQLYHNSCWCFWLLFIVLVRYNLTRYNYITTYCWLTQLYSIIAIFSSCIQIVYNCRLIIRVCKVSSSTLCTLTLPCLCIRLYICKTKPFIQLFLLFIPTNCIHVYINCLNINRIKY